MQDGEFRTIQREKRQYTLSHGCRNKVVMATVLNRSCNYLNGEGGGSLLTWHFYFININQIINKLLTVISLIFSWIFLNQKLTYSI